MKLSDIITPEKFRQLAIYITICDKKLGFTEKETEVQDDLLKFADLLEEMEAKNLRQSDVTNSICEQCGKYKTMQGNGIMHQLCECGLSVTSDSKENKNAEVAVAFADWIYRNDWEKFPTDIAEGATITHTTRWYNKGNERFTTEQLYDEFQKAKATVR